jgi:hypothetical protein
MATTTIQKEAQPKEDRRTNEQQLLDLENVDAEEQQHEKDRRTAELVVQQDLNQGMDTGTHSCVHRGVNWGQGDRVRSRRN